MVDVAPATAEKENGRLPGESAVVGESEFTHAASVSFTEDERSSRDTQQSESGTLNTWPALLCIKAWPALPVKDEFPVSTSVDMVSGHP